MKVELRDPNVIMKLSRLGSFHQSKLSFLRSFLNEFKDWEYKRDLFDLDKDGFGVVVYSFKKKDRVYSLICFANKIQDDEFVSTIWSQNISRVNSINITGVFPHAVIFVGLLWSTVICQCFKASFLS